MLCVGSAVASVLLLLRTVVEGLQGSSEGLERKLLDALALPTLVEQWAHMHGMLEALGDPPASSALGGLAAQLEDHSFLRTENI